MIAICAASSRKPTQSAASFAAQTVAAVAPCSSGSPNSKPLLGGNEDAEGEVMTWRFRKRIKILPGLWINLNKGAPSLSIGGRGATTNISKRGVASTVGLPGIGL